MSFLHAPTLCAALAIVTVAMATVPAAEEWCSPTMQAGDRCQINVGSIRPTQACFGIDVGLKDAKDIDDVKHDTHELEKYLKDNRAPAVVGPDGNFYIIDKHHSAWGLAYSGVDHPYYAYIACNWGTLDINQFWQRMNASQWVYLFAANGTKIPFTAIPQQLMSMKDDPYRSLANLVRYKGYNKTCVPFAEFKWANYFRQYITLTPYDSYTTMDQYLDFAVQLARTPAAAGLPGYVPLPYTVSKDKPDCPDKTCPSFNIQYQDQPTNGTQPKNQTTPRLP